MKTGNGAECWTVLEKKLLQTAKGLNVWWRFTFQPDASPKHTARAGAARWTSKHIHVLEWPI